jgi:hypothetical protein
MCSSDFAESWRVVSSARCLSPLLLLLVVRKTLPSASKRTLLAMNNTPIKEQEAEVVFGRWPMWRSSWV